MSNLYEMFGTDAALEKEGIALTYGDTTIVVARAGGANSKFQKVGEQKMRPYRAQVQQGIMDIETATRLLAEAYSEAVILGWENVKDAEGNDLEFTKENVVKVLLDLPDLFTDIQSQCQMVVNFLTSVREEDAKG